MLHARTDNQDNTLTQRKSVKCVVWDLDHTLWHGVLLEDDQISLHPDVVRVIQTLDLRGILHSIASKNDYATAMTKLEQFGLKDYFLFPQISWDMKSSSLKNIARLLNIGTDTLAFVDDQPFERDEVAFSLPEVRCFDAKDIPLLVDIPEMKPRFITAEASIRRLMYLSDREREQAESAFVGPSEAFLATLDMVFTISSAQEGDLQRVEELTVRTHQLNSTGYTYSYEELDAFRQSDRYKVLVAGLDDTYGTYGKIGLALMQCDPDIWTIKLLLMSCRVMSRGVGTILMNQIIKLAKDAGVRLQAEFLPTERNRQMYITYKFAGFKECEKVGTLVILEHNTTAWQPSPEYVKVIVQY